MAEAGLQLQRRFLEAVLLVRVMFDLRIAEYVDQRALSPACYRFFNAIVADPEGAQMLGVLRITEPPTDETERDFCLRLAKRLETLTLMDLTFYQERTLVVLVNKLPAMRRGPARFRQRDDQPAPRARRLA